MLEAPLQPKEAVPCSVPALTVPVGNGERGGFLNSTRRVREGGALSDSANSSSLLRGPAKLGLDPALPAGGATRAPVIDRVGRLSRGQTTLTLFLDAKMESLLGQMKAREHHEDKVNRWHLVLEATIVGLIVVEVMLFCYDLFFKGA